MSHWPGQAPTSYKRLLYAAFGHGTKVLDLYEMHSTYGTTENSVGEYHATVGTYEVAQSSLKACSGPLLALCLAVHC